MPSITNYHSSSVFDCVIHVTDVSGTTTVIHSHEPGPFGPLLSENRSGNEYYHHFDALGSTTILTIDSGSTTDTFGFDAWGNIFARTGATPTPYQWNGRWGYYFDSSTNDCYVRARNYSLAVARWTSADPALFIDGLNYYLVASNAVTDLVDPSGQAVTIAIDVNNKLSFPSFCPDKLGELTWNYTVNSSNGKVRGYLVQRVHVNCCVRSCNGTIVECTELYYFEAWKFNERTVETDTLGCEPKSCTEGYYAQDGEVRFYADAVAGKEILQWDPGSRYPVNSPEDSPCATSAKGLKSTQATPKFWSQKPLATADRLGTCLWKCCTLVAPCCGDDSASASVRP